MTYINPIMAKIALIKKGYSKAKLTGKAIKMTKNSVNLYVADCIKIKYLLL